MAGQPMQQTFNKAIEEAGGVEHFLERYISGESRRSIAESFGLETPFCLDRWRKHNVPQDVWDEAKRLKAEGLVEESLEDLETFDGVTSADAQIAKEKSSVKRWIAGKLDRESWGERNPADEAMANLAAGWNELAGLIAQNLKTLPPVPDEIRDADYTLEPEEDEDPLRLESAD